MEILNVVNTVLEQPLTQEQTEIELSTLDIDSIKFIHIIVALEENYHVEIPDEYLLITEMNTISKMSNVMKSILHNKNSEI